MFSRQSLFGFGAGLLFSAGFLFVFPSKDNAATSVTQEQLQAAADSLQMVVVSKAEFDQMKKQAGGEQEGQIPPSVAEPQAPHVQPPDQPQSPENKQSQPPGSSQKQKPSQVNPPAKSQPPNSAQVQSPTASATAQPLTVPPPSSTEPSSGINAPLALSPSATPSPTAVRETTVKIPGGSTSTGVAKILTEAGILPSETEFVATMNARKMQTRIRAGTYTIRNDITLNDLIKLLTTPPKY